jgi:hypothetical protein
VPLENAAASGSHRRMNTEEIQKERADLKKRRKRLLDLAVTFECGLTTEGTYQRA